VVQVAEEPTEVMTAVQAITLHVIDLTVGKNKHLIFLKVSMANNDC